MKTTAAITVALVLAFAALTAQAGFILQGNGFNVQGNGFNVQGNGLNRGGNGFNPFADLANELQARIQAAQDQLSRYPAWYPLFKAPDDVAISKLATELAEILIALSPQDNENRDGVPVDQTSLNFEDIKAELANDLHTLATAYVNVRSVGEALDALYELPSAMMQSSLQTASTP